VEEMREPELREIHAAMVDTVARAHADPDIDWKSGWVGNFLVHMTDDKTRGLCYEWQAIVYEGVRATVERVGWEATGIGINVDAWGEHHAVLVYAPGALDPGTVPSASPDASAYVLDAWKHGQPDIFRLAEWVELPLILSSPPERERPWRLHDPAETAEAR